MQSSKEKIEAQLCAYIDGELDDAERAEIERHLDANPQHKALISELRAASGLLKDLPRAKVPGDLNEGLTGQLERSVLLNPSDEESGDASLRIRRWPQFTAVAAVLLLATGLAFVVYYALPGSQNNHGNQVAMDTKSPQAAPASPQNHLLAERELRLRSATTMDARDDRGRAPDGTSDRFADSEGRKDSIERALAAKPTDSTTPLGESTERLRDRGYKAKRALEDGVATDSLALTSTKAGQPGSAVATAKEVEELQQRVRKLSGEADGDFNLKSGSSLYLVVSTRDAAVAGRQINAFFKDNGIPHMTQDLGAVALQSNIDAGARSEGLNFKYKEANEATPGSETARLKSIYAEKTDAPAQNLAAAGGARGEDKDQLKQLTKLQTADSDPVRKPAVETEAPAAPEKKNMESKVAQGAEPDQKREGADTTRNPRSDVLARLQTEKLRPEAAAESVLRKQSRQQDGVGLVGGGTRRVTTDETSDGVAGKQVAAGGGSGGAGGAGGFGAASYWNMRRGGGETPTGDAEDVLSRGTMIVARMNRRQAIALSTTLSQQDGQTAQLKQVAPQQQAAQGGVTLGLRDAVDPSKAEFARQFGIADPSSAAAPAPATSQPKPSQDLAASLTVRESPAQEPAAADKAPGRRYQERSATLGTGFSTSGVTAPTTRPAEAARETRGIANGTFNLNAPAPAPVAAADPMEDPVDVYIVVKDQAPAAATPASGLPAINSAPESKTADDAKK